jgi:hypothetical protein
MASAAAIASNIAKQRPPALPIGFLVSYCPPIPTCAGNSDNLRQIQGFLLPTFATIHACTKAGIHTLSFQPLLDSLDHLRAINFVYPVIRMWLVIPVCKYGSDDTAKNKTSD